MEDGGRWKMDGRWRMEDERWRIEGGGWRLCVHVFWASSGAVLVGIWAMLNGTCKHTNPAKCQDPSCGSQNTHYYY